MKNLRFSILLLLFGFAFGFAFGLNLVKGDVIIPWWEPSGPGMNNYYDIISHFESINNRLGRIFIFSILVLLLLAIFGLFLCKVFGKIGIKWRKALIPIKNLYCLVDLVKVRKISISWGIFSFLCWIGFGYLAWFFIRKVYILSVIFKFISYLPAIIIFFIYDYFVIISFYRLFRKFGRKKWTSILGTIFFPIGACILWFGKYEYQGGKLENREENN